MLSSNNIKNILTTLFNKSKLETDAQYTHLKTNMNKGWISSGTIEELHGVSDTSAPFDYYSTDNEEIIGQWIDGKPIYRKTFILPSSCTIPSNGWLNLYTSFKFDIPDRGIILSCKIIVIKPDDTTSTVPLVFANHYGSDKDHISILQTRSTPQYYSAGDCLIFEYTKLSDTSIDKKEIVANGINMQLYDGTHYTEDECIIGQWIDGKPLYRKVYTGTINSTTDFNINISDLNIDTAINILGGADINPSSGTGFYPVNAYWSNSDRFIVCIHRNKSEINCTAPYAGLQNQDYRIIVEYTKTTDTPYSVDEDIAWVALDSEVDDIINKLGE